MAGHFRTGDPIRRQIKIRGFAFNQVQVHKHVTTQMMISRIKYSDDFLEAQAPSRCLKISTGQSLLIL